MGTVAYLRISTSGQDVNTQRFAILDYAQKHGLVIDTFAESQSSSKRTMGERGLHAVLDQLKLRDTPDIQTKVMVTLFGLFAEIERDLIAERTKEGLAAARAKGRRIGRPKGALGISKLTGREADIQDLLAKTVSKASIAKIMGVSRSTLHHFICSRRLV